MDLKQRSQPPPSTKLERRIIEKNRRNQMKNHLSKLNSLLPNYNPREALPLPDQIDKAINYIKRLETRVKMAQEKKETLMKVERKISRSDFEAKRSLKSPKIEIHEMGSSLEVVLTCGTDNQFIFYEIIRILHEENIEVKSANSSLIGDSSILHVVHAEIRQSFSRFEATKVSERLKRFVDGSVSDVEIEPNFWDFETGSETWGLLDLIVSKGFPNPL